MNAKYIELNSNKTVIRNKEIKKITVHTCMRSLHDSFLHSVIYACVMVSFQLHVQ